MARKKQEIQLQREIETQEEWEEVMAMEGLWVVDVYQEWCGPCQALVGNFRRLKNELGDPLLNFAIAKADTIDALEKYRGRCEPTFLFFAGGILVSFIHGANSPKIQRTVTEQLAHEHKVLEGSAERKEVKDTVITRMQEKELEREEEEAAAREAEGGPRRTVKSAAKEDSEEKGVTVAIIKPDAVAAGKADSIVAELEEKGIEILAREERELTDEEAREIYSELEGEDYFEELIKFITSGPSHVLVLTRGDTGETIVKDWREMIGPTNVEQAQEEAPDSLRAKYGEKGYMNALHGSSSKETAAKELAFFFPNLSLPTYLKKKENIQRTLALIRPEAFNLFKDEIIKKIEEAGFSIALYKEVQLTREQAGEFYKEHEGNAYYEELISLMSSGTLLALGLARDEAISGWRDMLGPNNVDEAQEQSSNSMRAKFTGDSGINQFHGSDSEEAAKREINFFFPMEETVAVIKPNAMGTKDAIIDKIHEAGFRIAAHKETVITKEIADIMYPHQQEADYYDDLVNSITSGPTYFMVLTRENAIEGWRNCLGDTDPEQAKTNNPNSLRAQYGEDILNNALHGSSNRERAKEEMKAVFGDLEFNEDGTIKGQQPDLDEATVEKTGDTTTADTTTMDQTTLDDTTVDPTAEVTADTTQMNESQADTTQMDETQADMTVGDTTADETTVGDETTADTTTADTTTADTTTADTTQAEPVPQNLEPIQEPEGGSQNVTADETTEETTADQTTVDQTTAEPATADTTAEPATEPTTAAETQEQQKEQVQEAEEPKREATPPQHEETPAAPQQEDALPPAQQEEDTSVAEVRGQSEEQTQQEEVQGEDQGKGDSSESNGAQEQGGEKKDDAAGEPAKTEDGAQKDTAAA